MDPWIPRSVSTKFNFLVVVDDRQWWFNGAVCWKREGREEEAVVFQCAAWRVEERLPEDHHPGAASSFGWAVGPISTAISTASKWSSVSTTTRLGGAAQPGSREGDPTVDAASE